MYHLDGNYIAHHDDDEDDDDNIVSCTDRPIAWNGGY